MDATKLSSKLSAATFAEIARALGVDRSTPKRWASEPWFPPRGAHGWNVEAVRVAAESAGRLRRVSRPAMLGATLAPGVVQSSAILEPLPARELDEHEASLMRVLEDPAATDLARAEAGYALASKIIASAYRAGNIGGQQLDNFKKQGEELRRAKTDAIDLAERQGELISRDIAKAVAGALILRLLEILNNVENMLATQFEIWLADEAFRALSTDDRARQIRAWFDAYARVLRQAESGAVIDAVKREDEAA